ncbi:hypothetical protein BKH42_02470 [Helicobacter sp. 13S00482-2]|uniref:tRNA (5-methylaminomethyl-2-thiouridine)(34)-methyltransferase MnmD n=1 Tax=Helicobacter sp. 13S00482-2 TaxID=1476200 RepID=UPI000BA70DD9|nr:MnmC family methyltransferase [Helicobacter sp. 13S00482-2]PAF54096.1 hypothetical protein BKH42_02470 [Helicobacter sp. 13S00482-2]
MKTIKTADGTFTIYNEEFNECYHSLGDGAYLETLYKHILPPMELKNLFFKSQIKILDICFGLGYNCFTTISQYLKMNYKGKLEIFSPEKDTEIFEKITSLQYPLEIQNINISKIVDELKRTHKLNSIPQVSVELFLGDAKEYLFLLESNSIDVIYQDPFSPKKNPELWDIEYFTRLYEIAAQDCIITTYCTSLSVKEIAKKVGFFVYDHKNSFTRKSTLFTKKPLDAI